jgi:signal transduction histidine kinase
MNPETRFQRYRELQSYVGWRDEDVGRIVAVAALIEPHLPPLIDDFYAAIERHADARKVLTGGQAQIDRLKGTLIQWVRELFAGRYDVEYVERRWRVGWRHVEIGLDQVYTNVALSRLRTGLGRALQEDWRDEPESLTETIHSLDKLLDLDLAIIEDAYQAEYMARLQRGARLATLGQVAGGVAHELRNPLNVVKTSIYYLLNARNPTSEKAAEHLRRIERNVDRADGVITALTSFAKMPTPTVRRVPVEPCIREALEINPPGDGIHTQVDCPASLPPALADPDQLRIVLGNLIRNAHDAMPSGGRLSIVGRLAAETVEVEIADTGQGITPSDLARIMEPLYSTKARGLGLGLAIARSILDKLQGSLSVVSNPGEGSAFTVRLPAELHE